jgi:hypothetical protein
MRIMMRSLTVGLGKGIPISRTALALAWAGVGLSLLGGGCSNTESPDVPKTFGPYESRSIEDSVATPPHRMSQREYPFTNSGRYVQQWAYSGEQRYTGPDQEADPVPDDPEPAPTRVQPTPRQKPEPKPAVRPTPKPSTPRPSSTARYHTVAAGETLWRISQKYGVTISSLVRENRLNNYIIVPGQRLKLSK